MIAGARLGLAAVYLAATALIAALVHLIVILLIPLVATNDAYARLSKLGALNATVLLPRASPLERMIPYADPAVATSICRFDLASGPLRVHAPLGRSGFASISLHTRRGVVFYALTDQAATRGVIDFVVATAAQVRALAAHDDEDDPSTDLRVPSPSVQGMVVMRAFSELPILYADAEAQARNLRCANEPAPP
jgi:uncharacterized membrane protein